MDDFLSTRVLAGKLGVAEQTLRIWRQQGRGPVFVKLGGAVRYPVAEVARWLEGHTHRNTSSAAPAPAPERAAV
jgi:predicted site-specific integrase-resolvase